MPSSLSGPRVVPLVVYSKLVYLGIGGVWKQIRLRRTAVKLHSLSVPRSRSCRSAKGLSERCQPIDTSVSALLFKSSAAFWNTFCNLLYRSSTFDSLFASTMPATRSRGIGQFHTARHTISLLSHTISRVCVGSAVCPSTRLSRQTSLRIAHRERN